MAYFNYHAAAKNLILSGKLKDYYYTERQNGIAPALVLIFDDVRHPVMPVRRERWAEYEALIEKYCGEALK